MAKNPRGAAGGRANEGGSAHRAGAAAYLAAYGLAGRHLPVAEGESPGPPEKLWLEWAGEVDDLLCEFGGGGRWELQAKRRCDWDLKCFSKVLAQWVSAIRSGEYSELDRLVLVAGRVSEPLRNLRDAFRRLRSTPDAHLLPVETRALERLKNQAASDGWGDVFAEVIRSAMILELEVESADQVGFREAANVLDGTVVALGSGIAAINTLARFFQTEAVRSGSSIPTDWLRVLDEAGVPPGPSSDRAVAGAARAIATYRARLLERKDVLDVDLLAGGLPPMKVPDLLGTFDVFLPGPRDESRLEAPLLADLARRWRRFGIVGLPGSGKTTALEQLAAVWAADTHAPVPVLVRLHKVVGHLRDHQLLQVEDWCRLGDAVTPDVVPLLADQLRKGGGALLLDGLDECRDQQGHAAAAIRDLTKTLCEETSIIFSVREVASRVARSIDLPLTKLQEPRHLKELMLELVTYVATADRSTAADSFSRRKWVEVSQSLHPDLWAVPLFAVLLAVHAARTPSSDLPATPAEALVAAIKDSVVRWEREKAHSPSAWDPNLEPDMLLEAFGLIAHDLMLGQMTVGNCRDMVATSLREPWGLAPAQSTALADSILEWWNQRVGAFVVENGEIRPRLRMFAEVGDAMRVAGGSDEVRKAWLSRVLKEPVKYREPALLATALDTELAAQLAAAAAAAENPAPILLAADAVAQGVTLPDPTAALLLNRLGALFGNPPAEPSTEEGDDVANLAARLADPRTESDGPGWEFGYRLAKLPLSQDLRPVRDGLLAQAEGTERRAVVLALAATVDCSFDDRGPDDREREALQRVLELPLPATGPPPKRRSRLDPIEISSGPPVVAGRAEAVTAAIELIGLTHRTAESASELSWRVRIGDSGRLRAAIRAAGFSDALGRAYKAIGLGRTYEKLLGADPYLYTRFVLSVGEGLTNDPPTRWPLWREWRLDAAAALLEVLGEGPSPLGAGPAAVEDSPELMRRLSTMATEATGFLGTVVAAECRRALQMLERDPLSTSVLLAVPADPERERAATTPVIRDEDLPYLASCLKSRNPVLFWPAASWLDQEERPDLLNVFWDTLHDMWGEHRYVVAAWLPEVSGRTDVYGKWIGEGDPILRVVASKKIAQSAARVADVIPLLRDDDLMVRVKALRAFSGNHRELKSEVASIVLETLPSVWTCVICGSLQSSAVLDCTKCSRGVRRELKEEVVRLMDAADL